MTDFSKCLYSKLLPTEIFHHTTEGDSIKGSLHVTIEHVVKESTTSLLIKLTRKGDYGFLYSLGLKNDDYQRIKQSQGLLVDFELFPTKFVELLDFCLNQDSGKASSFSIYFVESKNSKTAEFNIVEKNLFKILVHLSLIMQKADEMRLIEHLIEKIQLSEKTNAARTEQNKSNEADLKVEISHLKSINADLETKFKEFKENSALTESNLKKAHQNEITKIHNTHVEKLEEKEQNWIQREEVINKANKAEISDLNEKLERMKSTNKELVETNCSLEVNYSEQSTRCQLLEEQSARYSQDLKRARKENCDFEEQRHETDKTLSILRSKCAEIESLLETEKSKNIRTESALEEETNQKISLKEESKNLKSQIECLKEKLSLTESELTKTSQETARLQNEYEGLTLRIRAREKEVEGAKNREDSQQTKLNNLARELKEVREELVGSKENGRELIQQLSEKNSRLDELAEKERTSQNVIAWLHRQLNDLQTTQYVVQYTRREEKSVAEETASRNGSLTKSDSIASIAESTGYRSVMDKPREDNLPLKKIEAPIPYVPSELLRSRTMSPNMKSRGFSNGPSSYFK